MDVEWQEIDLSVVVASGFQKCLHPEGATEIALMLRLGGKKI
jgi:hypothetical protein